MMPLGGGMYCYCIVKWTHRLSQTVQSSWLVILVSQTLMCRIWVGAGSTCLSAMTTLSTAYHHAGIWCVSSVSEHTSVATGAHKYWDTKDRPTPHDRWTNDVLPTGARLCLYLDHSCITAVQLLGFSNCPVWSMTERSKFLFRTSLFSVVGALLGTASQHLWAPYCHHPTLVSVGMLE